MTAVPSVAASYRRLSARRSLVLMLGLMALALSLILDCVTGPALLPVRAVADSILRLTEDRTIDAIVWRIRLPAAVMALLVGAGLGLSGGIMQTILNNPLASCYTLGISAGAGFGAALAIVAGVLLPFPEAYAIPISAFLFAGVACYTVFAIGRLKGGSAEILILAGIALLFLFQALLSLLQFLAAPEALQQMVFWLFGSLQKSTWPKVGIVAAACLLCVPLIAVDVWRLMAMTLGDARAQSLGVRVGAVRLRAFVLISVLTGASVAFVGTIGFVGLAAPHIARMLVGEDQRGFLPASAIFGALLLSLASVVSKIVVPGAVFPIGIVTALIGVPFFLLLILRHRGRGV